LTTIKERIELMEMKLNEHIAHEDTMVEQAKAAIIHLVDFKQMMSEIKADMADYYKKLNDVFLKIYKIEKNINKLIKIMEIIVK